MLEFTLGQSGPCTGLQGSISCVLQILEKKLHLSAAFGVYFLDWLDWKHTTLVAVTYMALKYARIQPLNWVTTQYYSTMLYKKHTRTSNSFHHKIMQCDVPFIEFVCLQIKNTCQSVVKKLQRRPITWGVNSISEDLGKRTGMASLLAVKKGQTNVSFKPRLSCLTCLDVLSITYFKLNREKLNGN